MPEVASALYIAQFSTEILENAAKRVSLIVSIPHNTLNIKFCI